MAKGAGVVEDEKGDRRVITFCHIDYREAKQYGLQGTDREVYYAIKGFKGGVVISLSNLADDLGITKPTLSLALARLWFCGLLTVKKEGNKHRYEGKETLPPERVKKLYQKGKETLPQEVKKLYQKGKETLPYTLNNNNNNINNNNSMPTAYGKERLFDTEKTYTLAYKCQAEFEQIYLERKGEKYYWVAKDAHALKLLLQKIRFYMDEGERENEDKLLINFQCFINAIFTSRNLDNWTRDNVSMTLINSKFNEIYTTLKNGNGKNNANSAYTDAILSRLRSQGININL